MSNLLARQFFHPSCPRGGDFYACATGSNFVGCCDSEPCAHNCADGNLSPASFDPALYGTFADQSCPSGSRWYTCKATNPPFMGCCKSNPCAANGCPDGDLTAAFLSSNPKAAAAFLGSTVASSATSTASTASSTSTISSTTTPTGNVLPGAQPAATPVSVPSSPPTGAIAGGAAGGVAVLAILIGLLIYCCRRKTAASRRQMNERNPNYHEEISAYSAHNAYDKGVPVAAEFKHSPYTDSANNTPLPTYQQYHAHPSDIKPPSSAHPSIHPSPSYELPSTTTVPTTHELPLTPASPMKQSNGLNITNAQHPAPPVPRPFAPYRSSSRALSPAPGSELAGDEDIIRSRYELDGGSTNVGMDGSALGPQRWGEGGVALGRDGSGSGALGQSDGRRLWGSVGGQEERPVPVSK